MSLFVSGMLLSFSLCLDLGIVNIAVLRAGIQRGMLPALLIGLGSGVGDLIYAGLSGIGISLLLQHVYVRWILWIFGTVMLLYLTGNMLRESIRPRRIDVGERVDAPQRSVRKDLLGGIALALASPSAILWFATVGGSVIAASSGGETVSLLAFFGGFFTASVMWSVFMAFLAAQGRRLMGPGLVRGFSLLSAAMFLYFAVKVFLDGYRTLL